MNAEHRSGSPGLLHVLIETHDFERFLAFLVGKAVVGIRDSMNDIVSALEDACLECPFLDLIPSNGPVRQCHLMRQGAFAIHFVVVPAAGIYHLMRLTVYLVFVNVFTVSGALPVHEFAGILFAISPFDRTASIGLAVGCFTVIGCPFGDLYPFLGGSRIDGTRQRG